MRLILQIFAFSNVHFFKFLFFKFLFFVNSLFERGMPMFCSYCGSKLDDKASFCPNCGAKIERTEQSQTAETPSPAANNQELSDKSKLAAGLLGILLGGLGIHNFYLGFTGKGVAQLLLSLLSFGLLSWISGIWGLIEGIMILVDSNPKDAKGKKLRD